MLEFSPLCLERLKLDDKFLTIIQHIDSIHLDIMDGKFVDNTAFCVDDINSFECDVPKHVHIMSFSPIEYIDKLENVDSISFHYEVQDCLNIINKIKNKDIKVGLVINPETPIESIYEYLPFIDRVIIMAVNPGFSGQKYISETSSKILKLRNHSKNIEIVIDGGMNEHTIREVRTLGADAYVVCSVIAKSGNVIAKINELKEASNSGIKNKELLENNF